MKHMQTLNYTHCTIHSLIMALKLIVTYILIDFADDGYNMFIEYTTMSYSYKMTQASRSTYFTIKQFQNLFNLQCIERIASP
jgi:hypothetical protein